MMDATRIIVQWTERLWTLSWGSIVLFTALRIAGYVETGDLMLVWQASFAGFCSVQVIKALGDAAAIVKTAKPEDK